MSDEHKKNLSKAHKGRKPSENAIKAASGGNSAFAKTVVDPEGRVFSTIKECAKFYKTTINTLKKRIRKPDSGFIIQNTIPNKLVLNKDTGIVYKSIKSCAKAINRSDKFVSNICKGVSNNTSFNLCFVDEDYCKTNNISPV